MGRTGSLQSRPRICPNSRRFDEENTSSTSNEDVDGGVYWLIEWSGAVTSELLVDHATFLIRAPRILET